MGATLGVLLLIGAIYLAYRLGRRKRGLEAAVNIGPYSTGGESTTVTSGGHVRTVQPMAMPFQVSNHVGELPDAPASRHIGELPDTHPGWSPPVCELPPAVGGQQKAPASEDDRQHYSWQGT